MNNTKLKVFDNFEVEPSAGVWKMIEAELPVKKNRRWIWIWFLPLFIISMLSMLVSE